MWFGFAAAVPASSLCVAGSGTSAAAAAAVFAAAADTVAALLPHRDVTLIWNRFFAVGAHACR
jgi:hypothetical protein